jgi:hypothetical protein
MAVQFLFCTIQNNVSQWVGHFMPNNLVGKIYLTEFTTSALPLPIAKDIARATVV